MIRPTHSLCLRMSWKDGLLAGAKYHAAGQSACWRSKVFVGVSSSAAVVRLATGESRAWIVLHLLQRGTTGYARPGVIEPFGHRTALTSIPAVRWTILMQRSESRDHTTDQLQLRGARSVVSQKTPSRCVSNFQWDGKSEGRQEGNS